MFLYKGHKNLSHKQASVIGFVLAVLSILSIAIAVYVLPLLVLWLNSKGVYHLDIFIQTFIVILFLSAQGLILFGFPLYYAQDKKSHMTGFQILIYALMWMVLLVGLISVMSVSLVEENSGYYDLEDFVIETEVEVME